MILCEDISDNQYYVEYIFYDIFIYCYIIVIYFIIRVILISIKKVKIISYFFTS